MDLDIIVVGFEGSRLCIGLSKAREWGLADHRSTPPSRRIDTLREVEGLRINETSASHRGMHLRNQVSMKEW